MINIFIIEAIGVILESIWTFVWSILKALYESNLISQSSFVQSIVKENFNPTGIMWLNKALFLAGVGLSTGITFGLSYIGLKSFTASIVSTFAILLLSLYFVTQWWFWVILIVLIALVIYIIFENRDSKFDY